MAIDVYASFNMHQNALIGAVFDSGTAFPSAPVVGQPFVLTPGNVVSYWNGTAWTAMSPSTPSKFAATIGDSISLSYTVTHGLGTLDTVESVYSVATGLEMIAVIQHATVGTTVFTFTVPPALNSVRVVILAS
jgi:hypothetical protein